MSTEEQTETTPAKRRQRKTRVGKVTSTKMQKTIVVEVTRKTRNARYGKILTRSTKFKAHDEHGTAKLGDLVLIEETRPMSRDKRWRLKTIVTRAVGGAAVHHEEVAS